MSQLFAPYTIQNMTLKNRIVMSPMCMYSCSNEDGKVMNWHKIHYTSRAVGQVGLIMLEASAVTPAGRISAQDLGIWSDEHISELRELVNLIHEQDAKVGIQLAHAGRKATVEGDIIAPSAIPFAQMKTPKEMSQGHIRDTIHAFVDGARRAKEAGFDCIEIHGAHGYLISEFLSPLSNHRDDRYGGDRTGRYTFLKEIITEVKKVWKGPLFVRLSCSDYHPEGNTMDDILYYARQLKEQGVDLIDCSSGGVVPATLHPYPGYQVPFADKVKNNAKIATGAVGLITTANQAEEILQNNRADLIFLGRELLRNPYWARAAAHELGNEIKVPTQYKRGWCTT